VHWEREGGGGGFSIRSTGKYLGQQNGKGIIITRNQGTGQGGRVYLSGLQVERQIPVKGKRELPGIQAHNI